jgi:L-seryl-tRNA(Ser) seleniumtransferase
MWQAALAGLPGISAERSFPNEAGQPTPRLLVTVDAAIAGVTGAQVRQRLWASDPAIAVGDAGECGFYLTPDTLDGTDASLVTDQIMAVLPKVGSG